MIASLGICFAAMIYFEVLMQTEVETDSGNQNNRTITLENTELTEETNEKEQEEAKENADLEEEEDSVQETLQLYAQSAVLLDADSGRILYEKNGYEIKPMASTTKIMTCIMALEYGNLDDVVTVSSYAASQPKVHLGMSTGEQFTLRDLLYSLMLESHNDSAVAIAEHIGCGAMGAEVTAETTKEQSKEYVLYFADMMNQKARDIGCYDTTFITPNGLDATLTASNGNIKTHSTTAADLARILRYCITESSQKDTFLEITRTTADAFSNVEGTRAYSCNNHNAFLTMMDGALTGKTGYTSNAGYCYVGALKRDDKTFVVALLACGWPNHKTYKWSDTKKLMNYGLDNYAYEEICDNTKTFDPVEVLDGQETSLDLRIDENSCQMLINSFESIKIEYELPDVLEAPVLENDIVGSANYYIGDELVQSYPVYTAGSVKKIDYWWCLEQIVDKFTYL